MSVSFIITGLSISLAVSILVGVAVWRVSPYFISKRDRYRKSQYDIWNKKMAWAIESALLVMALGVLIMKSFKGSV